MLDKRGQGLSTSAIILIVLGVIILVILAVGFSTGWAAIKDRVQPDNNVQDVVSSCGTACALDSVYDFCSKNRTLFAEELPKGGIEANCTYFSGPGFEMYGVEGCPSLC